ncbi:specifically androgen-regulated gene protein [Mugil cephalus]|uniref:specifically androgen-regulated gene protein n=1 Tax=Mugil cephalus TaxID=48193 RepID=UPI001FB62234|nr:specifically androgen-regulated gene protein [Mugil cephalus]
MPESDTWAGTGLDTTNGMDCAGSCDSVASANSGCSDDSLDHLSPEEKACILFLEKTIESLDTEDDSGLSNDESDQMPTSGSLPTTLTDVSASASKSKPKSSQKSFKKPNKENVDAKLTQSSLVPTPLVVANGSQSSVPTPVDKNLNSKPQVTSKNKHSHKHNKKAAPQTVPLEVNVMIAPSTKPRDNSARTAEDPLPRGPLSYEALVHLRKNASTKKTPLCPTVDHTIDSKHPTALMEDPNSKTGPQAMAPKPSKKFPANISVTTQKEVSVTSDSSHNVNHASNPKVVRQEALQKLGLPTDEESENDTVAQLPPSKSHSSLDPKANRSTKGNTSRSPSFCCPQVSSEPKIRSLQSSASFHHSSRCDQQAASASHPAHSNGLKPAAAAARSAAPKKHKNSGNSPQRTPSAKPAKTAIIAQPANPKSNSSVGYTMMVVPGMGSDRKEALKKLGLLKH